MSETDYNVIRIAWHRWGKTDYNVMRTVWHK